MLSRFVNAKKIAIAISAAVAVAIIAWLAVYYFMPFGGERYRGGKKDGRYHGHGVQTLPQYGDMLSYTGEFANGFRNGHGIMLWRDGKRYEGQWSGGMTSGWGIMTYPPGDPVDQDYLVSFEGEFARGRWGNHGIAIWQDGRRYEGGFKDGQPDGQGRFDFADDDSDGLKCYEGGFVNGHFEGRGTMIWKDGARYEGQWRDNQINGQGVLTFAPGNREGLLSYEGESSVGRPHGRGTMTWKDGTRYEGQWCNGLEDGQGVMTLKNGMKYEGTWMNGRKHDGVEYSANGREIGRRVDGRLQIPGPGSSREAPAGQ